MCRTAGAEPPAFAPDIPNAADLQVQEGSFAGGAASDVNERTTIAASVHDCLSDPQERALRDAAFRSALSIL